MKKKIVYIAVIAAIVLTIVIAVVSRNMNRRRKVAMHTVTTESFSREVSSNGEIMSQDSEHIISSVSGRITAVHIESGDDVKAGDLLVSLDLENMENSRKNLISSLETARMMVHKELIALRSAYMQAVTSYEQAEREYLRSQELHDKDFASDVELQSRRDAYHIANNSLTSAMQQLRFREGRDPSDPREFDSRSDEQIVEDSPEVQQALLGLASLESDMGNYSFSASLDGVVTDLPVENGGVVTPGMTIASVHNRERLEVLAFIDEVDLSYLQVGQPVRIESDSFIGTELEGRVKKIAPLIRKIGDSRVCEIRVEILENPDNIAKIGASCSIFITVENRESRPSIPVESYFIEDGEKFVFLMKPDEYDDRIYLVEKREIETGILGIDTVEIIKGLEEGEIILNEDRTGILEGDEVERAKDDQP